MFQWLWRTDTISDLESFLIEDKQEEIDDLFSEYIADYIPDIEKFRLRNTSIIFRLHFKDVVRIIDQLKSVVQFPINPIKNVYYGLSNNEIPNGQGTEYIVTGKYKKKGSGMFRDIFVPKIGLIGYLYYVGKWKNGVKCRGIKFWINGKRQYVGKYSRIHSKKAAKGTVYFKNGNKFYEGTFAYNVYNGEGIGYYNDGTIMYKGTFSGGRYHGLGLLYYSNGTLMYNGNFSEGKFHYFGRLYSTSQKLLYVGNFLNGYKNGNGREYYDVEEIENKVKYLGDFIKDKFSGSGTLYSLNGDLLYYGNFKDNEFHRDGTLYWPNTTIMRYSGIFDEGLLETKGTLFFKNGSKRYFGGFKALKTENRSVPNLYGIRLRKNALLWYIGNFKDGHREGIGIVYSNFLINKKNQSVIYKGLWKNGFPEKRGSSIYFKVKKDYEEEEQDFPLSITKISHPISTHYTFTVPELLLYNIDTYKYSLRDKNEFEKSVPITAPIDANPNVFVRLGLSDGTVINIDKKYIVASKMIFNVIEDTSEEDEKMEIKSENEKKKQTIYLAKFITKEIIDIIIIYLKHHYHEDKFVTQHIYKPLIYKFDEDDSNQNNITLWDKLYVLSHDDILVSLFLAANFLNIPNLLELLGASLANEIIGKTSSEVRIILGMKDNLTSEEKLEKGQTFDNQFSDK